MLPPVTIRRYERRDREAVRRIACDTADCGEPVERFFHDREVFADLVTSYYTDYEPQSLWVAEHQHEVIGYLTGCLDSRRWQRLLAWRVVPRAMVKAISRGTLWSSATWRLIHGGLQTWRQGGFPRVRVERYPVHFHLNIQRGFRGQHVGTRLVERFLTQAQEQQRCGVHVAVRRDNMPSCAFFQRLGFVEVSSHRVIFPSGASWETHETVIYVKPM
ncbi:MAG: GNAT family N-acetyltransferase [Candidatus Omnitrophica bacterium]|nr:GNAT family N-acetyltransferase [Candidatus Omnitrophota bacterium]